MGFVGEVISSGFVDASVLFHDDVIKRKYFPHYWSFVRRIHWSPVNSPHKGQWRGALMFSLICAWINDWVNSRETRDLKRHGAHYDVTVTVWWGTKQHEFILKRFHTERFVWYCCLNRVAIFRVTNVIPAVEYIYIYIWIVYCTIYIYVIY